MRKLQESQEYNEPVTWISRKGGMKEAGKISNVEADLEMALFAEPVKEITKEPDCQAVLDEVAEII